jgi:serine/threonine protein kinase/ActR/RegA family two-component response regulator
MSSPPRSGALGGTHVPESKARILVADDSRINREMLASRLEEAGYEVVTVEEGTAALDHVRQGKIDLVILDIIMPGISGLDVLESIRKDYSKLDLPVLMATARSDSRDVVRALELGANDYVTKPLDLPVALARIQSHLGIRAQLSTMSGSSVQLTADGQPEPGTLLDGRYELLSVLGEGGFAVVYKARQLSTGQTVAVKALRAHRLAKLNEAGVELARFEREMKLIGQLQHPHIVRLVDSGRLKVRGVEPVPSSSSSPDMTAATMDIRPPEGRNDSQGEQQVPYLVMEFLDGEPMLDFMARKGRVGVEEALELMLPVLSAVEAAHMLGVIHRDLKPHNIFLVKGHDGRPHPKVLDFGIAKLTTEEDATLTGVSSVVGTPKFLSPEQARGFTVVDERSDQYTLGTILYGCVTGSHPYQADSFIEYIHLIAKGQFDRPSTRVPELPKEFDDVLMKAMSIEAAERYPSVKAFGKALLKFGSRSLRARWARAFDAPSEVPPGDTDPNG